MAVAGLIFTILGIVVAVYFGVASGQQWWPFEDDPPKMEFAKSELVDSVSLGENGQVSVSARNVGDETAIGCQIAWLHHGSGQVSMTREFTVGGGETSSTFTLLSAPYTYDMAQTYESQLRIRCDNADTIYELLDVVVQRNFSLG